MTNSPGLVSHSSHFCSSFSFENLCISDWSRYVSVSNLALIWAFFTSRVTAGNELQTGWTSWIFNMSLLHNFIVLFPSTSSDSLLVHFFAMLKLIPRFHASLVGNASTSTWIGGKLYKSSISCILEKKALRVVFIDSQLSFHQVLQLCVLVRLILSRSGLVASYVALLLWVAHREEGILLVLLFGLEEIGSISRVFVWNYFSSVIWDTFKGSTSSPYRSLGNTYAW